MKYFFALFVALLFRSAIFSQDIIKEMPTGFDTLQTNIHLITNPKPLALPGNH